MAPSPFCRLHAQNPKITPWFGAFHQPLLHTVKKRPTGGLLLQTGFPDGFPLLHGHPLGTVVSKGGKNPVQLRPQLPHSFRIHIE